MAFHIRNNGISYQLNRIDSYKEEIEPKTNKKDNIVDQNTIYRLDAYWKNCNKDFKIQTDDALPGCSNYYLECCPNGVFNVKTFAGVTLKNIYSKIDMHYYEKESVLKYDYIVAPGANYKQIQIEIKGSEIELLKMEVYC